ncbi:MAG: nicotinate-nucleotide adenylyltransferase [Turneriella sp.]|nr:nicotinate-nucleotide adenylyltransferase [Turneriella sp.]
MPAASAPLRADERLFSYRERFRLLRYLFKKEIAQGSVVLSWLERRLPQPNYTIHTLDALKKFCFQKPILAIGADQAEKIQYWQSSSTLIQNYEFLIFARNGVGVDTPLKLPTGMHYTLVDDFDENISATKVRASLFKLSYKERFSAAVNNFRGMAR